jgi:RNA polymerase sigma factor (sigma-70 family)
VPDNLALSPEEFASLKQGDETAQVSFMRKFASCIKGLVKKRFGLLDVDAEDVVAETLYKVIKNIHKFDPGRGAKFSTWVFQITVNTARDWCRKNSENSCLVHDIEHLSIEPDKAQNKEELTEDGRLMRDAMSKLDEIDRQILEWFTHDVPLVQIAKYLEIQEGTVRQRKKRALQKLKAIYESISN